MYPSILVEEYRKLPIYKPGSDVDLFQQRRKLSIRSFRQRIAKRYTEGTLQRMLYSPLPGACEAAITALGGLGTLLSNSHLARMLHHEDGYLSNLAADSLWELWFRGGSDAQNRRLQEILHLSDPIATMQGLNELLEVAPEFAEVWNQRGILHFQQGDFRRALEDCQRTLKLNPFHFGAQCGMGHCYYRMQMPRAAIQAYRLALDINPKLEHLEEVIRGLEATSPDGPDTATY